MNYLPFVSWGMYGGTTAKQRANFFASWGMMGNVYGVKVMAVFMHIYRRFRS